MATELRKTEIDVVGDMAWGTHFCLFYETKQDLLEILVPYFKTGLENNEFCLWVISEPLNEADARDALRQAVPDLDRYLAERSIEILPYDEWYFKGGAFELHRVISGWKEKLAQALARGYAGMRVATCTAWLQKKDWKDFRAYEVELSESIAHQRMIVLCAYSLAASGAADILDVTHTHQVAVTVRNGHAEVIETPELKQAKTAIQRLSEELEQRVVERTRELTAANEELRREIAERKQIEEKLRLSEERLRLIVETIPGLVWSALPDGSLEFLNHAGLEYMGRVLNDIRGWGWEAVMEPEDLPAYVDRWRAALATGEPFEAEARVRRADGVYRWLLASSAPLRDELGNIVKWYGTLTDITERKQAEEALERAFQEIQVLKDQLYQENLALREEIDTAFMFEEIVGTSPVLHAVLGHVAKVPPTDSTVLITGETGTGKELIARAIHKRSPRSSHAFVSVNCAAIPPSLVASELFGHEKGAFTSALQQRLGRFELANGGTLFLDEIGELPTETQNTLLRVLQEREFERVGGNTTMHVDVRVIAATNRDLQAAIAAGAVHSDLFYRLNVFPIELPPLRDRKEDIPLLVKYFLDRYARKAGKKIRGINPKTLGLLQTYSWPGNIRELQNVIERLVILCETETFTVDASWLAGASVPPSSQPLSNVSPTHQRKLIEAALAESRGRVAGPAGAAAKLGMPPSTLESKIRALKINKYRFKTD